MTSLYRMIVAYDGTRFQGFQRQVDNSTMMKDHHCDNMNKRPRYDETGKRKKHEIVTVQDVIERALMNLYAKDEISVADMCLKLAGRTDKGVHATGQVIAVKLPVWNNRHIQQKSTAGECSDSHICNDENWNMRKSINSRLPSDITIQSVHNLGVDSTFDPRQNVRQKQYTYRIKFRRKVSTEKIGNNPLINLGGTHSIRYALDPCNIWICPWMLDDSKFENLFSLLSGTNDYANFVHKQARDTCDQTLTVDSIAFNVLNIDTEMIVGGETQFSSEVITGQFVYKGRGFRRTMLRNFTGYIVDVCRGLDDAPSAKEAFENTVGSGIGARINAAPAIGLCLEWIKYEDE